MYVQTRTGLVSPQMKNTKPATMFFVPFRYLAIFKMNLFLDCHPQTYPKNDGPISKHLANFYNFVFL